MHRCEVAVDNGLSKTVTVQRYILQQCGQCEQQLRRYFCLARAAMVPEDEKTPAYIMPPPHVKRTLTVQLSNFLYDTYIRLLMSGYQQVVVNHKTPVLACLKQVLNKLTSATDMAKPQRQINLGSLQAVSLLFDELTLMFDEARKRGTMLSLDLVLPEYVDALSFAPVDGPSADLPSPLRDMMQCDYQMDSEPLVREAAEITPATEDWRLRVRWLSVLQTFYRPLHDEALLDHRRHREGVYIPVYRFGDDKVASMSMSTYIGNTMRRNIRQLYDFIDTLLVDLPCARRCCPCVVIFNLFVRDHFRVYHSKSLPQTNFIQIYDDSSGRVVKISYMLIANKFPKIAQWFSSINNQFLKKTGYARILHIDSYARLIASACQAGVAPCHLQTGNRNKKKPKKNRLSVTPVSALSSARHNKKSRSRRVRFTLPAALPMSRRPGSKRKEKMTLSYLVNADFAGLSKASDSHLTPPASILSAVYRSGFIGCPHRNVERIYTQKRAHDESASLALFCHDCHCYL